MKQGRGRLARRRVLAGLGVGLGVGLLGLSGRASAHPYHLSLATAHHRPTRGRLEVSLRLRPEDLDAELGRRLGRKVELGTHDFDPDSELDRALARLLRDDFRLTNAEGVLYGLHLVGRELERGESWVYFELATPAKLDGLALWVGLLFGLEAEQENTVNLVLEQGRRSLVFRRGDRPRALVD